MGLLISALYLVLSTCAGGLLLSLTRIAWSPLERIASGFFVGLVPTGLLALGLAIAVGFGPADFWAALLVVLMGGLAAGLRGGGWRAQLGQVRLLPQPDVSWIWAALAIGPWAVYFTLLFTHAFVTEPGGLYAGHALIWGDWALHLSYASSFLYGSNLPPDFPVLAHQHYEYHFMVDFLAAGFSANGLAPTAALAFGSWATLIAFVAVFFCVTRRLTGSAAAGFLAPMIFMLGSGLGFVLLLGDLQQAVAHGSSFADFFAHLPRDYTHTPELNYEWFTPVFGYLVPQRSIEFGFSIALISLVLLREGLLANSARVMVLAGILLGLSPLFHLHATSAMGCISLLLAAGHLVANRGRLRGALRLWIAFGVPFAALALPTLAWMYPQHSTGLDVRYRFGWLAFDDTPGGVLLFWLKNLGLFIPLAIIAQVLAHRFAPGLRWFVLPFWALFAMANFLILQPWDWDNTKWFTVWMLATSVLVAGFFAWLARSTRWGVAAVVVLMSLTCLSGLLDVWRNLPYQQNRVLFASSEEVRMAAWVRGHTPARALFLTAENHNHAIPTLAGRRIFVGYPGWLWVFTLPYAEKDAEAHQIYAGSPNADELLHREGIQYVVIGPTERSSGGVGMSANQAYFDARYQVVYRSASYSIYRV